MRNLFPRKHKNVRPANGSVYVKKSILHQKGGSVKRFTAVAGAGCGDR